MKIERNNDGDYTHDAVAGNSALHLTPYQRALGRAIQIPFTPVIDKKGNALYGVTEVNSERPTATACDLSADIFWQYYLPDGAPTRETENKSVNQRLIEWASESNAFKTGRENTAGCSVPSAFASDMLRTQLVNDPTVLEALQKQMEAEKAASKAEEQRLKKQIAEASGDAKAAKRAERQMNEAQQRAEQLMDEGNQMLDDLMGSRKGQAVRAAATMAANEAANEVAEVMAGWGIDPANLEAGSNKAVIDAMQDNRKALAEISKLVGRMKGIAMKQIQRKPAAAGTVIESGYTRKLMHVLPGELALVNPNVPGILRAEKMAEFADRGLLGMVEGYSEEREGGLVVAVDRSGSMQGYNNVWSSALAVGFAIAARDNGQPFEVFEFNRRVGDSIDENAPLEEVMAWAGKNSDGGTDFDVALLHAVSAVDSMAERAANSDIVFITDGDCSMASSTVAALEDLIARHSARILWIDIGRGGNGSHSKLGRMLTQYHQVNSGADIEELARKLAEGVWMHGS